MLFGGASKVELYGKIMSYKDMSKKELFRHIKCCLWRMIDTYSYLQRIDSEKLCQNFSFWNDVRDLCIMEWNSLKIQLIVLMEYFIPRRSKLFRLFSYKLKHCDFINKYEILLRGADQNTQEYHCLIHLFDEIDRMTPSYKSEFIHIGYNRLTKKFYIRMMGETC